MNLAINVKLAILRMLKQVIVLKYQYVQSMEVLKTAMDMVNAFKRVKLQSVFVMKDSPVKPLINVEFVLIHCSPSLTVWSAVG